MNSSSCCAPKGRRIGQLPTCWKNMASRPVGRAWPNTAASSWTAENHASGGNGRRPCQTRIRWSRLKVCQPCPQNPARPRQHQRTSFHHNQPKMIHINRGDRALRVSEWRMAVFSVKKAPAIRRRNFPAVTNACAAASARSLRRPLASVWNLQRRSNARPKHIHHIRYLVNSQSWPHGI